MRDQEEGEDRVEYLAKVLYRFMQGTSAGYCTMVFDGVKCDGFCLAEDFINELGINKEDC